MDDDAFLVGENFLERGHIIINQKKIGILNVNIQESGRNDFFKNLKEDFYYTLDFFEGAAFLQKKLTETVKFNERILQGSEGLDYAIQTLLEGSLIGITKEIQIIHTPPPQKKIIKRVFFQSFLNTTTLYLKYFNFSEAFVLIAGTFLTVLMQTKGSLKKMFFLFWSSLMVFFKLMLSFFFFSDQKIKDQKIKETILYLKRCPRVKIPQNLNYSIWDYCVSFFSK